MMQIKTMKRKFKSIIIVCVEEEIKKERQNLNRIKSIIW